MPLKYSFKKIITMINIEKTKYTIIPIVMLLLISAFFIPKENIFDEYDQTIWSAMLAYKEQNYKESLGAFRKAFALIKNDNSTHYFYAAAAALRLNKEKEAEVLIEQAILGTKASKAYFTSFKEFEPYREKVLFDRINEDYEKLVQQYYANLPNPDIYKEIERLIENDQEVRKKGAPEELMLKTDSVNMQRLIEISNEHGWYNKSWLLLWHQRGSYGEDNYVWNYFRPFIDQQIKEGKERRSYWAVFDDMQSIMNEQVQIYGTFQNQYPIKDIKNIDKRRALIGLPPLWYMNKVYNMELPEGYEPIKEAYLLKK